MIKYVRDKNAVMQHMVTTKAKELITKVPCVIHSPTRYVDIGLSQVGMENFILGSFPIILNDNKYALCNIPALVEIDPFKVTKTTIDDVDYNVFHFNKGDRVIKTLNVVLRDTLMFDIFDELIFKGKVPWYMGYEDMAKIFDESKKYAGSNIGEMYEVQELITSIITRRKDDLTKRLRNTVTSKSAIGVNNITYVPLRSIYYSVNSTLNKLAGNYFSEGIVSALVDPSNRVGRIESILRA